MKTKEYYPDMRSITGCLNWAESTGLISEISGSYMEIAIPRDNRDEVNICVILDSDEDDLEFINMMNRLRRWKEQTHDESE